MQEMRERPSHSKVRNFCCCSSVPIAPGLSSHLLPLPWLRLEPDWPGSSPSSHHPRTSGSHWLRADSAGGARARCFPTAGPDPVSLTFPPVSVSGEWVSAGGILIQAEDYRGASVLINLGEGVGGTVDVGEPPTPVAYGLITLWVEWLEILTAHLSFLSFTSQKNNFLSLGWYQKVDLSTP